MLKGLYLSAVDHNSNTAVGVVKKINSQIKAFKKSGISISNISLHDNKIVIDNVLTDEKIIKEKVKKFLCI